jgi:hypothetical protein
LPKKSVVAARIAASVSRRPVLRHREADGFCVGEQGQQAVVVQVVEADVAQGIHGDAREAGQMIHDGFP